MQDQLQKQRTFALIGHGGTGKTSVAEMLLFTAGSISRLGKIEDGTTTLDYEPEETKHQSNILCLLKTDKQKLQNSVQL